MVYRCCLRFWVVGLGCFAFGFGLSGCGLFWFVGFACRFALWVMWLLLCDLLGLDVFCVILLVGSGWAALRFVCGLLFRGLCFR